jgi:hypothetical protein
LGSRVHDVSVNTLLSGDNGGVSFSVQMTVEPKTDKMLVDTLVANSAEEACGNHPVLATD